MTDGSVHRAARRLTAAGGEPLDEIVAEEVAVALVYNGISHAVMMATPCDLEDFGRGFSLSERIVDRPSEIYDIEVEPVEGGIEVRLDIAAQRMARLQERRQQLAGTLSGGERQMLAMGRALMARPTLLMLDEPSLGLAPKIVRDVFHILTDLRKTGVSILLVEQNARAALEVADYTYVMELGAITTQGSPAEISNDPRLVESYLGLGGNEY